MTTSPLSSSYNAHAKRSPIATVIADLPMTLGLIMACVLVFICQTLMGVNPTEPTNQDLINWGANFMPYTLSDEGWRMFTSLFLHIGIWHLVMNMAVLLYFGRVAERLYGSVDVLVLFLLSGIGGNVLNNFASWHGQNLYGYEPNVSAGASGAIVGICLALLVSLFTNMPISDKTLYFKIQLWGIVGVIVAGFFMTGIDNAGHFGGALTGLVLGLGYFWRYKKQLKSHAQPILITNQADSTNYPLWAIYAGVLLFLEVIFWRLHDIFIHLPAVGIRSISGI